MESKIWILECWIEWFFPSNDRLKEIPPRVQVVLLLLTWRFQCSLPTTKYKQVVKRPKRLLKQQAKITAPTPACQSRCCMSTGERCLIPGTKWVSRSLTSDGPSGYKGNTKSSESGFNHPTCGYWYQCGARVGFGPFTNPSDIRRRPLTGTREEATWQR